MSNVHPERPRIFEFMHNTRGRMRLEITHSGRSFYEEMKDTAGRPYWDGIADTRCYDDLMIDFAILAVDCAVSDKARTALSKAVGEPK